MSSEIKDTRGRDEPPHRQGPHDDQCEFNRVQVNRCGCYKRRRERESQGDTADTHKIGDRVMVLHNAILGNLIGTVTAIHERTSYKVYDVELDGGGTDHLYGFQLQPLSESQREAAGTADEKPDGQAENSQADPR